MENDSELSSICCEFTDCAYEGRRVVKITSFPERMRKLLTQVQLVADQAIPLKDRSKARAKRLLALYRFKMLNKLRDTDDMKVLALQLIEFDQFLLKLIAFREGCIATSRWVTKRKLRKQVNDMRLCRISIALLSQTATALANTQATPMLASPGVAPSLVEGGNSDLRKELKEVTWSAASVRPSAPPASEMYDCLSDEEVALQLQSAIIAPLFHVAGQIAVTTDSEVTDNDRKNIVRVMSNVNTNHGETNQGPSKSSGNGRDKRAGGGPGAPTKRPEPLPEGPRSPQSSTRIATPSASGVQHPPLDESEVEGEVTVANANVIQNESSRKSDEDFIAFMDEGLSTSAKEHLRHCVESSRRILTGKEGRSVGDIDTQNYKTSDYLTAYHIQQQLNKECEEECESRLRSGNIFKGKKMNPPIQQTTDKTGQPRSQIMDRNIHHQYPVYASGTASYYHPFGLTDVAALALKLPAVSASGDMWIHKFTQATMSLPVALGDVRQALAISMSVSNLENLERDAGTAGKPDITPLSEVCKRLYGEIRDRYPTPKSALPSVLHYTSGTTPAEHYEQGLNAWIEATGRHPDNGAGMSSLFRRAILDGLPSEVMAKLRDNPDTMTMESDQFRRHVIHHLQLHCDIKERDTQEEKDLQAKLTKLQFTKLQMENKTTKKENVTCR